MKRSVVVLSGAVLFLTILMFLVMFSGSFQTVQARPAGTPATYQVSCLAYHAWWWCLDQPTATP